MTILVSMVLIKNALFLFIASAIASIFGLTVLEIIFGGWVFKDPWFHVRAINVVREQKIIYNIENISSIGMARSIYTRDKFGLRGFCSNPRDIDILTIGGSTTDQRYISDGLTYQDVLQNSLSSYLGKKVCVSNAGVAGHSTFGHQAAFDYWFPLIDDLNPKYYLFYVGINDAGFRFESIDGADNPGKNGSLKSILQKNSAIYDLLKKIRSLYSLHSKNAYAVHKVTPYKISDYTELKKLKESKI